MAYQRLSIIGAGSWGIALATAALRAGRDVMLWTRNDSAAEALARSRESPLLGGYDHQTGVLDLPPEPPADEPVDLRELRELVPAAEPGREVDDWGRSQRVFDLIARHRPRSAPTIRTARRWPRAA